MRYVVIEHFCDMGDNGRSYNVGDSYPRKGLSVTDNRLKALATAENALHRPLIKLVESEKVKIEEESAKAPTPVETIEKPVVESKSKSRRKKEQAEK